MENYTRTFKVSDKITFKDMEECFNKSGNKGSYYYGGLTPWDKKGVVTNVNRYEVGRGCFTIWVSYAGGEYKMLESEFEEYDKHQISEEEYLLTF